LIQEVVMRTLTRLLPLGGALVLLAGCSSSGQSADGPQPVADGSYAFLASSAGGTGSATLEISGNQVTLAQDGSSTTGTMGAVATEAVLCPPSGKGQPVELDASLTVGELALAAPAIFGDCGGVTPKRVTVVDLDSYDEGAGPFSYTRWVEFCDTTDPDCPAPTT
jgi:hypothetical protein